MSLRPVKFTVEEAKASAEYRNTVLQPENAQEFYKNSKFIEQESDDDLHKAARRASVKSPQEKIVGLNFRPKYEEMKKDNNHGLKENIIKSNVTKNMNNNKPATSGSAKTTGRPISAPAIKIRHKFGHRPDSSKSRKIVNLKKKLLSVRPDSAPFRPGMKMKNNSLRRDTKLVAESEKAENSGQTGKIGERDVNIEESRSLHEAPELNDVTKASANVTQKSSRKK